MPARGSEQTGPADEKGKLKVAERKRVLKKGSDREVVRAFANKKGKEK